MTCTTIIIIIAISTNIIIIIAISTNIIITTTIVNTFINSIMNIPLITLPIS